MHHLISTFHILNSKTKRNYFELNKLTLEKQKAVKKLYYLQKKKERKPMNLIKRE
jgi:hypothetical protein